MFFNLGKTFKVSSELTVSTFMRLHLSVQSVRGGPRESTLHMEGNLKLQDEDWFRSQGQGWVGPIGPSSPFNLIPSSALHLLGDLRKGA